MPVNGELVELRRSTSREPNVDGKRIRRSSVKPINVGGVAVVAVGRIDIDGMNTVGVRSWESIFFTPNAVVESATKFMVEAAGTGGSSGSESFVVRPCARISDVVPMQIARQIHEIT